MHRHFFSLRIAGMVVLAAVAVASVDLWLNGFAVVADPDGQVARATLRHPEGDRPMNAIADGFWAARPRGDGSIVIQCRDGPELSGGHVSRGGRTRYTVRPGVCARR